jgi:sugar lactone lactonase YvrE
MTGTPLRPASILSTVLAVAGTAALAAQPEQVPFDSDRWDRGASTVVEHLGRPSLRGGATLKDVAFSDGVVEVDVAMDGRRCFPGVVFRLEAPGQAEYVYLRPHRSGEPTALQYTPLFNGLDAWQLYHGPGFTAAAEIPHDRWVHLRLEVKGTQARLFLDGKPGPALVVHDLKRGATAGTLGLIGPPGGQVHFSGFSFDAGAPLDFAPPPAEAVRPGLLSTWQLSRAVPATGLNRFVAPAALAAPDWAWREVRAEPSGLVNVSRTVARTGPMPDCVLARTTITAAKAETRRLAFGYSDEITIFLNGTPLFWGDASFQRRDPMFYGAVGLTDAVFLPLVAGRNELLFVVAEAFGGWGFMAQLTDVPDGPAVLGPGVARAWETPADLAVPESVAFDPARRVLFVSSFVGMAPAGEPTGFVSRLSLAGEILDRQWVKGLRSPSGLAVRGDRLFAVERDGVAEIDIPTAAVLARHPIAGARFLNDVAVAPDGTLYVSDSGGNVIYRLAGGKADVVASGAEVQQPNGLLLDGGRLLFGNTGDGSIKALDLASGKVTSLLRLGDGIVDGLRSDGAGNLIVSLWHGTAFRVTPAGLVTPLVDTDHALTPTADLEFVADEALLVVPTYSANRVVAYRVPRPGGRPADRAPSP